MPRASGRAPSPEHLLQLTPPAYFQARPGYLVAAMLRWVRFFLSVLPGGLAAPEHVRLVRARQRGRHTTRERS